MSTVRRFFIISCATVVFLVMMVVGAVKYNIADSSKLMMSLGLYSLVAHCSSNLPQLTSGWLADDTSPKTLPTVAFALQWLLHPADREAVSISKLFVA